MKRLLVVAVLTLVACNQNKSDGAATSATQAPLASVQAPASAVAASTPAPSAKAMQYAGTFKARAKKSATTAKEGAPQAWEKDNGATYAGDGKITLSVAADGTVQGALAGALGDRTLRGQLSGDELRATLVTAGTDITQIQNGTLVLKREGSSFKGVLTAATGNALILREAEVTVAPAGS
jgi:hypothetical protein